MGILKPQAQRFQWSKLYANGESAACEQICRKFEAFLMQFADLQTIGPLLRVSYFSGVLYSWRDPVTNEVIEMEDALDWVWTNIKLEGARLGVRNQTSPQLLADDTFV